MASNNIVLIGMMGSGKSVVARQISARGYELVDTDEIFVKTYNMSISQCFESLGESVFRARESQIISSLQNSSHSVISTGGGVVLNQSNMQTLSKLGKIVYLQCSAETIYQRIRLNKSRPLLTNMSVQSISKIMEDRASLYSQWANITIDTQLFSCQAIADRILSAIALPNNK